MAQKSKGKSQPQYLEIHRNRHHYIVVSTLAPLAGIFLSDGNRHACDFKGRKQLFPKQHIRAGYQQSVPEEGLPCSISN
jgi:hypothetical protein